MHAVVDDARRPAFSLLDVLPASFEDLPETLDAATKTEITHRLEHGGLLTQAQWADLNP